LFQNLSEKNVDKYFAHFEIVAGNLNWAKPVWALMLQSVLVCKAAEVFSALTVEQRKNYETVKELILKAY